MITDPPPRGAAASREHAASDLLTAFAPAPPAEPLRAATEQLIEAVGTGEAPRVRRACVEVLRPLSEFFGVDAPPVRILGVRPHQVHEGVTTYQLFGDYDPETLRIRVWLRTAIQGKVTTPRSLLSTLLHEFCHHLDCVRLGWPGSYHTRGFYTRVDQLYHLALATPDDARRPLHWVPTGKRWRIDWTRLRAAGQRAG